MNKRLILTIASLTLITTLTGACSALSTPSTSTDAVTFVIPIQAKGFSEDATLSVRLWNAEQLTLAEKNAACVVSYEALTETETITCPEGVEYHEATPEEFYIAIGDVGTSITIASKSVQIGEQYRLQISGLSSDNCNSASASVDGTADSQTITLGDLSWMTTMMGCP